jgi:hypothetical protein
MGISLRGVAGQLPWRLSTLRSFLVLVHQDWR